MTQFVLWIMYANLFGDITLKSHSVYLDKVTCEAVLETFKKSGANGLCLPQGAVVKELKP